MAGETPITIVGNIVDDPELRYTPSGAAVCNFRIASTPRKFNRQTNQFEDGDTLFLGVATWRQLAENCAETLHKGMRVVVVGHLTQRQYEKRDGTRGSSYDVQAEDVAPSLRNATARVEKTTGQRQQPQQNGQQQRPPADPWTQQAAQQNAPGYSDQPPF